MKTHCDICYNIVCVSKLKYLECSHYLCVKCYKKLRSENCPFCRCHIELFKDYNDDKYYFDKLFGSGDWVIPNKIRREKKLHNKINKQLELEPEECITYILPNLKKRTNRKINLIQII